ncbi:Site-specific recombinase XerD [Sporobacter termitidis DSM 10068]|uniref:Site-specific recombinase XerD n=1 Tax=Sporobacter termitidis DSM 10068 TaxID=1123282 RepID=A0A1M5XDD1_9FIRM|nr:site-specific integrase [Sporobacter termitidis]SHH97821.1 Site-specific recombinase XerD [Sporobacter termitidis DSM 10068]
MFDPNHNNITYTVGDRFHTGMTVRSLFALWLPSIRKEVSPSSYRNYERIVRRHILPELGECEIDLLTVADINDFLKDKMKNGRLDGKGGLSRKTVEDISWVLRSVLKLVNWDYSFVTSEHAFIKSIHEKRDTETLSDEQASILVRYLVRNLDRSNAGFLICLFTGIKLSEICALKDTDFLLDTDRLQIRRTLQRVTMQEAPNGPPDQQETVEYGEADSGHRDLELPTELSMLLWTLLRGGEKDAYFLTGAPGAPLGPRTYQYRFQSVLSCCGLPLTINFHILRHTFALLWMHRYHDMESLSRALGHASVKVTQNRYGRLLQDEKLVMQTYVKLLCASFSES